MGHVLSYAYFDFVARYKRMQGFNVFYPQGWDCQGFPTEVKVESKFGRHLKPDVFRKHCVEWTTEFIARMRVQMQRMGFSPDWRYEYRTMDDDYHRRVQYSLLQMYDKSLVYRGEHPVYWCTRCESAIAKAEIDDIERSSELNYIKFKLEDGKDLIIATTRPEYLHACVAVFVNPTDERYTKLVGKAVSVPIFNQKVKIIVDKDVDKEFGSGAVMVCTYGDKTDVIWQHRHKLGFVQAMDGKGHLMNAGEFNGLVAADARKKIIEKLTADGLLEKQVPTVQAVKVHDRCNTPVELLNSIQWFAKIKGHEQEIIDTAKKMNWVPAFTIQYLIDWAEYVEWDWVISRQRIFGTPLPFWFCESCKEVVPAKKEELPVDPRITGEKKCEKCGGNAKPETSTCDVWVDSSITPLIIGKWPDDEKLLAKVYPASLRPQGTEIIRTWAFYTIYRCLMLTGKPAFKELLLNGNVLAPDGKKMSKSLGNIIAPDALIEQYSADAVRQWASLSGALAKDRPFAYKDIQYAQTFVTKLWNASKFVEKAIEGWDGSSGELRTIDKWMLSRLNSVVKICTDGYESFDFYVTMNTLHNFFWHEFCDYYLEEVKHRLYQPEVYGEKSREAAQYVLSTVLLSSLKMLAPVVSHVTEELYQEIFIKGGREKTKSIHLSQFPKFDEKMVDEKAGKAGALLNRILGEVRKQKGARKMALNAEVEKVSVILSAEEMQLLPLIEEEIKAAGRAKAIELKEGEFGVLLG